MRGGPGSTGFGGGFEAPGSGVTGCEGSWCDIEGWRASLAAFEAMDDARRSPTVWNLDINSWRIF